MKYKGTGLSDSLDSFSVDIENGSINTNRNDNKELKIRTYLIDLQYYLSVCSKDGKDILEKIEREELYLFLNRLKHL
ncbi:MAG: hypothetical protein K2H52_05300 [Lachnospiraceae bacterium]|nr:hypothetical protein [Lachnospiraceae bacterium]